MRFWNSLRRVRAAGVIAAAVMTLGTVSAGATLAAPANAAACNATSCAGHDPTVYGCTVSSTVTTAGALATVWNRYSIGCDANWARGQLTQTALNAGDTMSVEIFTTDSNFEEMTWPTAQNNLGLDFETSSGHYGGSSIAYSDMVNGTDTTDAYVLVYNSSGTFVTLYAADQ